MTGSKTLRIDGPAWSRLQASKPGKDALAAILAEHRAAPVRAFMTTVGRDRGVRTQVTVLGGQVVVVARRLARDGGETRIEPGAQVTFSTVDAMWPVIARTLPDVPQLRAPSSAASGIPERELGLPREEVTQLLEREEFGLQVRVEAWRQSDAPAVTWVKQWSVTDGMLLDARLRGAAWALTERPVGSVATELRWAIIGAIDTTTTDQLR